MKPSFDRNLREKLLNANASEAGFDLNKEALWDKINKKEATKKKPILLYFSHAAAVAAGLLIALFLFNNYSRPKERIIVKTMIQPSASREIKDTVYLQQTIVVNKL